MFTQANSCMNASTSSKSVIMNSLLPVSRLLLFFSVFSYISRAYGLNSWRQILPRESQKSSSSTMQHPSPRRGQSMTMDINGKVYMFGGLSVLPSNDLCTKDGGQKCNNLLPTNELWQFDPVISSWEKVEISGDQPEGREQHSATVMSDNRVLVFGGKTTYRGPENVHDAFLGDLWLLDVRRVTSHTVPGSSVQALPLQLPEGETVYHTTNASIASSDYVGLGETCVVGVQVEVTLEHSCTKSVSLALFGPGPVNSREHLPRHRGQRVEVRLKYV